VGASQTESRGQPVALFQHFNRQPAWVYGARRKNASEEKAIGSIEDAIELFVLDYRMPFRISLSQPMFSETPWAFTFDLSS